MKKRVIVSSVGIFIALFIGTLIFVNADNIKFITFKDPETQVEREAYKKMEQDLDTFRNAVVADISHSFNIDIDGYLRMDDPDLFPYMNNNKSFADIYRKLDFKVGDIKPYVYINESSNEAFILRKRHNGTNEMYELIKQGDEWELVNFAEKESIYMNFESTIKRP